MSTQKRDVPLGRIRPRLNHILVTTARHNVLLNADTQTAILLDGLAHMRMRSPISESHL